MPWKAVLETGFHQQDRLFLACKEFNGKTRIAAPLTLMDIAAGELAQPTMYDSLEAVQDGFPTVRDFMQAVLDEAWAHGLRPKSFESHENELTAVRYHLEDMRKLAKVKD